MSKMEQSIEEWEHAVSEEEDIARRGDGSVAKHSWVLRLREEEGRGRVRWPSPSDLTHGGSDGVVVA